MNQNLKIPPAVLDAIREMDDFDLTMLLSEINDYGWEAASKLVPLIEAASERGAKE